jgi:hypothetical protein
MLKQTPKQGRKGSTGSSQTNINPIRSFDRLSNPRLILVGVCFFIHLATDSRPAAANLLQSRSGFVGRRQNTKAPSPVFD